jgi:alpha-L-fucosidase
MLINIGPGRDGKLPEPDASRLLEFGAEIRRRFSNPVSTEFERRGDKYVIKLGGRRLVNHLVLGEDIASGERIEGFRVTANIPVTGGQAQLYEGRTVGHKRIVLFPTIRASELTVEVTACDGSHSLASAAAYYVEQPAYTPVFG